MTPGARVVPLDGATNFRDLGGYAAASGRRTRWGRLYRSDSLHQLTAGDLAQLRALGLATVVDLRTAIEVERTALGWASEVPVHYRNLSVLPDAEARREATGAPARVGDELVERYLWYLDVGREALAEAVRILATAERYPLVFHCAAGKDRTGVLAALVLDTLEVDREVIVQDYVATAASLGRIVARLRADPHWGSRVDQIPPAHLSVEAATMETFLDELHRRYGGAAPYLASVGVSEDALAALPELLLEEATAREAGLRQAR